MGKSYRPQRLGEEIRKLISELLLRGALKDPGFSKSMISVNAVDVTRDGSYAYVYITALNFGSNPNASEEEKSEILKAFERSKGFIRTEIGKAVKVRHVPELIFRFDNSAEYGAKMDALIDSLDIPDYPEESETEEDFDD